MKKEQKIIVFDIDDTLIVPNDNYAHIYRTGNGERIALNTREFADESACGIVADYDFSDFRNPDLVYKSIITGKLSTRNMCFLKAYLTAGYKFCFLTSRGCADVAFNATLDKMCQYMGDNLRKKYIHKISCGINDDRVFFAKNMSSADRKAFVLKNLCKSYDTVVFVDDDKGNRQAAIKQRIPNLFVMKA